MSLPRVGKHMVFNGKLLHGAPADLVPLWAGKQSRGGADTSRVTLLVNVWLNHKPRHAAGLPKKAVAKMTTPVAGLPRIEQCHTVTHVVRLSDIAGVKQKTWSFGESAQGGHADYTPHEVVIPVPVDRITNVVGPGAEFVQLEYEHASGCVRPKQQKPKQSNKQKSMKKDRKEKRAEVQGERKGKKRRQEQA
mmetsp:Transcript_6366/g.13941  ORF Transcript_6366/g.13941 Transcript_6366/m.13941 type:complete len:192 (+) Transcript_6366:559-1134(+)